MTLLAGPAKAAVTPTFYFIGVPDTGRWCAYATRAAMLKEERRLRDSNDGVFVDYELGNVRVDPQGHPSALSITVFTESGDWAVTDSYRLKDGAPTHAVREVGYADGEGPVRQNFVRTASKWRLQSSAGHAGYIPDFPLYARISDGPFYPFVMRVARGGPIPTAGFCNRLARSTRQGRG